MSRYSRPCSSQTPSFDTIREKVTEDYRLQQALDAARKAGTEFQAKLTNGLALSKSFSEICLEANVTPINLPPFSIATNSIPGLDESVNVNLLKNVALSLKPSTPGPFLQTPEGGFIVFLRAKLPVDETKMRAEMPGFLASLRQYQQNEAFSRWVQQQEAEARLTKPLLQKEPRSGAPPVEVD